MYLVREYRCVTPSLYRVIHSMCVALYRSQLVLLVLTELADLASAPQPILLLLLVESKNSIYIGYEVDLTGFRYSIRRGRANPRKFTVHASFQGFRVLVCPARNVG